MKQFRLWALFFACALLGQQVFAFDGTHESFEALMGHLNKDRTEFFLERDRAELGVIHDVLAELGKPEEDDAVILAQAYMERLVDEWYQADPKLRQESRRKHYVGISASWMGQAVKAMTSKKTRPRSSDMLKIGSAYAQFFLDQYDFLTTKERDTCLYAATDWLKGISTLQIDSLEARTWLGRMNLFLSQKWFDAKNEPRGTAYLRKAMRHYRHTTLQKKALALVQSGEPITRLNLP